MNPVNILEAKLKDGRPIIEIEATPTSNDVVGLQDLYLQLDTSSSVFDVIVDNISSGLDPSASNYNVSSSYPNGNLVRSGGPVSTRTSTTLYYNVNYTTTSTPSSTVSTSGASTSGSSSY